MYQICTNPLPLWKTDVCDQRTMKQSQLYVGIMTALPKVVHYWSDWVQLTAGARESSTSADRTLLLGRQVRTVTADFYSHAWREHNASAYLCSASRKYLCTIIILHSLTVAEQVSVRWVILETCVHFCLMRQCDFCSNLLEVFSWSR